MFTAVRAASTAPPPVSPAEPSTPKPATTTDAPAGGAMGKDQFLQLLVAQMRNQDPTSPMDGTQMAAQLAQFSTVEQLTQANATLTTIAGALRAAGAGAATGGSSSGTS